LTQGKLKVRGHCKIVTLRDLHNAGLNKFHPALKQQGKGQWITAAGAVRTTHNEYADETEDQVQHAIALARVVFGGQ
jgi:hypothetical protein